jgi:hypothetical protein
LTVRAVVIQEGGRRCRKRSFVENVLQAKLQIEISWACLLAQLTGQ